MRVFSFLEREREGEERERERERERESCDRFTAVWSIASIADPGTGICLDDLA